MIAGSQTIADDRRRSQTIAEDRTWFYLLRSSAITIAGSQTIAEVCFHMIADDCRTFCDLRSAIRDRLRSYGNQPLKRKSFFQTSFLLDKKVENQKLSFQTDFYCNIKIKKFFFTTSVSVLHLQSAACMCGWK